MIVSVSQFDVYSGNCEDSQDVVSMKESMLSAAQEIVAEYLGYNPESSEHTDYVQGIGNDHLYLFAQPITEVDGVTYNGITLLPTAFDICGKYLRLKEGVWPNGVEVTVTYTAGWTSETVPDTVKMTILQIASLMLEESGGNIGITGKSMDENSRTFINYNNYDKWLRKLDPLRIVRLYG